MKEEDLKWMEENHRDYLSVLCHAILLDKVKIVNGRIKVEYWEE